MRTEEAEARRMGRGVLRVDGWGGGCVRLLAEMRQRVARGWVTGLIDAWARGRQAGRLTHQDEGDARHRSWPRGFARGVGRRRGDGSGAGMLRAGRGRSGRTGRLFGI